LTHPDVASDVTTALAQSDHHIDVSHKFDNEFDPSESSDKSDDESVSDKKDESVEGGEEEKVSDNEEDNSMSMGDHENGSEGDDHDATCEENDDSNEKFLFVEGSDEDESMSHDGEEGKKEEPAGENKTVEVVNADDLNSDEEALVGIAKRMKRRKGKVFMIESQRSKATKKKVVVGPAKGWSKVEASATKKKFLKKKEVLVSDSDYDVRQDVKDIVPAAKKRTDVEKKLPINVPEAPIDNISFHYVVNIEKLKYVFQRRLDLEIELGKDALEFKEVIDLIDEARLRWSVSGFGNCYELLVKEFIVNNPKDCDSPLSK